LVTTGDGLAVTGAARTTPAGLALAAALLACGAGWLWLMAGEAAPDQVADTVLLLAVLTPALITAGRLAGRVAVIRPARPARVWLVTGHWLSAACTYLNVGVVVIVVAGALYAGWGYTPPSSDVLPLPATVTVISDRDQGCPALDRCRREIDVIGAAGLSPEQTAQIVTGALTRLHGWRLDPVSGGCRPEGWLLGRMDVCLQVQAGQNAVQLLLDSSP
jgi:hypothetical protein